MVEQVEASVVLLRKVNVAHHGQDLNDAPEVFSDGIVQWCVPIRVLKIKNREAFMHRIHNMNCGGSGIKSTDQLGGTMPHSKHIHNIQIYKKPDSGMEH